MFDMLKKKLTNFIDKVVTKTKFKLEPKPQPKLKFQPQPKPEPQLKTQLPFPLAQEQPEAPEKPKITEKPEQPEITEKPEKPKKPLERPEAPEKPKITETPEQPEITKKLKKPERATEIESLKKPAKSKKEVKLSILKQVTSFITKKVIISAEDVEQYLEMLELELLESDVAYEVSQEIICKIRQNLVGMEIPKDELQQKVTQSIKQALAELMDVQGPDIFNEVKNQDKPKPVKILFIGPNGAGKTTTIAKFAHRFKEQGNSVLLCAADTFRAAAIEQLEVHAKKLNLPILKAKYGADPASVGFDAVNHAVSKNIDIVLIDSAGRQDTNYNLMEELKKIYRVIKPDYVLYVGESFVGNAIVEQVNNFRDVIPVTGVILTKIDCDAKGGSALSVAHGTGVPILYLGTGQHYDELVRFNAKEIVDRMVN